MNFNRIILIISSIAFISLSCTSPSEPKALDVIPDKHQLEWQELEYYMFMHFGPNTFTDVEWGDGKEDPKVFNPTDLDTRQWASIAKDAGMKGIIITAKHHDGFCLWPSAYSTHTVRESPWKDGKGDILKELSESCKEYGLKFGVYLSPWDQNHPAYGTAEYNEIFAKTLEEVLTNYGDVYEQWFDGANGGNLKHKYDWDLFHSVVYKHQPQAIIFSDIGPGCRWIGNERGVAGETNWSRLDIAGFGPGVDAPSQDILNQGQAEGEAWVPGEVDVSIRPGWFYSPKTDDKVKTVSELMDIYYTSVGRNANLLLNVPADRRGRIHPADSTNLMQFRDARIAAFKDNLAAKATLTASNVRGNSANFAIENLLDGKKDTYWATDDDVKTASVELQFSEVITFNRLLLQENISLGQRVAAFDVQVWDDANNSWNTIANATTIGYKRILRLPTATTKKIKINITDALASLVLSNLEIYNAPSLDSDVADKGEYRGIADRVIENKNITSVKEEGYTIKSLPLAESIIVNLKKEYSLKGFTFTPDRMGKGATIQRYNLYVSPNGKGWTKVISNSIFNNIKNNPIQQSVLFEGPHKGSFIKLEPLVLTVEGAKDYKFVDVDVIL